jgi:hypothetical protein
MLLKSYLVILALALLLATPGDSWSRSRHKPQPQNKSSPISAQQSANQPTPPENFLTTEQIKKAITDGIDAATQEYETRHPTTPPDNSGWWFNFLLVAFTGGLVVVGAGQAFLIFWTLKATQTAANAAKESADGVIATERAYVFPGYDPITYSQEGRVTIPLVMTNVGKTPAVIKQVGYAFLDRVDLPASRDNVDWDWETIPYDWAITTNDRKSVRTVTSPYAGNNIFVCYVRYVEIFVYKESAVPKPLHTTWMSMLIRPDQAASERSARAGGDTWNEWD